MFVPNYKGIFWDVMYTQLILYICNTFIIYLLETQILNNMLKIIQLVKIV